MEDENSVTFKMGEKGNPKRVDKMACAASLMPKPENPSRWVMFTTFGADRVDLELNVEEAINQVGIDSVVSYSEYYDPREGRYVGKILYRDFHRTRL